jgi:hypothetical protein
MQPGRVWRALCLWSTVLLCPLMASAQEPPPAAAPSVGGNGFKVGAGRLHPYLELETRLDSGVGYFPSATAPVPGDLSPDTSSEVLLHIRPGFRLDVPSPRLALHLSGNLDYVLYTGWLTAASSSASHLQARADLSAHLHEQGPVGFVFADQFIRSDRARSPAVGAGVLSLFNELRASMPLRPGGGAIEIIPEVAWAMESFQSFSVLPPAGCTEGVCDPAALETFDYHNVRGSLDGRWRFLPKTAVVLDTDFDLRGYSSGNNPDAKLLRIMGGLAGLVSPKVAVTAKAGWGQDFGTTGGATFLLQLEGTYLMSPTMTFKGGYLRTLEPVSAYGLYRDDRGYVEGRALFGGKLALHGTAALDLLSFLAAATPRDDTVLTVDLGPDYQIRPWLMAGVGYQLNTRSSSSAGSGLNYTRHEGYFRVTATY